MLFKGTAKRGPGEIARSVEAHGGEMNAWTSYDQTVYHVVMASRFAREGLDVLADAVRNSAFDPGELSREIEVVSEEIKRSLDTPSRRASKELFSTAFAVHPYGRPVIGFEADVHAGKLFTDHWWKQEGVSLIGCPEPVIENIDYKKISRRSLELAGVV